MKNFLIISSNLFKEGSITLIKCFTISDNKTSNLLGHNCER